MVDKTPAALVPASRQAVKAGAFQADVAVGDLPFSAAFLSMGTVSLRPPRLRFGSPVAPGPRTLRKTVSGPIYRAMIPQELALAFVALVFVLYLYSVLLMRVVAHAGLGFMLLAALGQCAWLAGSAVIAGSGYLVSDVMAMPPLILRVILAPALLTVLVVACAPAVGRALDHTRGDWLVSIQAFRILMELILHGLWRADALPERLTFTGLNFDILSGLLALPVGYLMHKGRAPRWLVLGYNGLGLTLLAVIVVMSVLSAPTPLQVFSDPPGTGIVFHVPFVWLPAYVVPMALLFHLLSLRHCLRKRGLAPAPAAN